MNAPIFYVGGSKGGVGKSKLCFSLIEYLLEQEKKVLLLSKQTLPISMFSRPIMRMKMTD